MTSFLEREYAERAKVPDPKPVPPASPKAVGKPLAIGQTWFVLNRPDSNTVNLFKIVGLWNRVVALQRPSSSTPEYYLNAQLRFVEQVPG